MKKRTKVFISVILILIVLIIVGKVLIKFGPRRRITDVYSTGFVKDFTEQMISNKSILDWYSNIEDARNDFKIFNGYVNDDVEEVISVIKKNKRIASVENDEMIVDFYLEELNREKYIRQGDGTYEMFQTACYLKNENKYSGLVMAPDSTVEAGQFRGFYSYNFAEQVADQIREVMCVRGLNPDCFGMLWGGADTKLKADSLTIMGHKPDVIVPFERDGETYYLWCYKDVSFMADKFKSFNWYQFTLGQVVDEFEIRYDNTDEVLFNSPEWRWKHRNRLEKKKN